MNNICFAPDDEYANWLIIKPPTNWRCFVDLLQPKEPQTYDPLDFRLPSVKPYLGVDDHPSPPFLTLGLVPSMCKQLSILPSFRAGGHFSSTVLDLSPGYQPKLGREIC